MRPRRTGAISFGLVNVPVSLYSATRQHCSMVLLALALASCATQESGIDPGGHAKAARSMSAEERAACAGMTGPAEMRCLRMIREREPQAKMESSY